MRILVSNDDGVYSPGLACLAEVAAEFGTVRVVAPDVEPLDPPQAPTLWTVGTKADIAPVVAEYSLSATNGIGIGELMAALMAFAEAAAGAGRPSLLSRERDLVALTAAQEALDRFLSEGATDEIAAEHLRQAGLALERLVGRIDTEQVLDRLFASFCIGK